MKKAFNKFIKDLFDQPPIRVISTNRPIGEIEYMIAPVSFRDLNEYVDILLEIGEDGWEAVHVVRVYLNSPVFGYTTKDYLFKRKIS
jgi:hypothetical protein